MSVRFVRDIISGLFIVSLLESSQRQCIVVQPDCFIRHARVSPRAVLGSATLTPDVAAAIGFLVDGDHPTITVREEVPA